MPAEVRARISPATRALAWFGERMLCAVARVRRTGGDMFPDENRRSKPVSRGPTVRVPVAGNQCLTSARLSEIERRSEEYADFLSCGGALDLFECELSETARIMVFDVPRMINVIHALAQENVGLSGHVAPDEPRAD